MNYALGCVAHLLAIAAVTFWLDAAVSEAVAAPLRPWTALVASTLLVLGVSNVVHLLRGYGQGDDSRRAILARAAAGTPPPEGGPMVVTGVARPEQGVPLTAPLSGRPCVAYEYRIYKRERVASGRQRRITVHWLGTATQPFLVETAGRAVRVLAAPRIVEHRQDLTGNVDAVARARQWVRDQTFESFGGTAIASVFASLTRLHLEIQARGCRHDWHREGFTGDPATLRMDEDIVPVGETISLAGHWSPELQAIIPEPGGLGGSPVSVVLGGPSGLSSRAGALPSSALAVAVFGVLLLAAGGGLAWAMSAGYLR